MPPLWELAALPLTVLLVRIAVVARVSPPDWRAKLPLTVLPVRVAVTAGIPAPKVVELPLTVLLVNRTVPAEMPPPSPRAMLPLTVLLVTVPSWTARPPTTSPAVLPVTVLLASVAAVASRPPPMFSAALPPIVQLVGVTVSAQTPPPLLSVTLPVTRRPVRVAVPARMPAAFPPRLFRTEPPLMANTLPRPRSSPGTLTPPPSPPEALRATVVRTRVTFPVPGWAALETPPPDPVARLSVTAQSWITRSALSTRMPPPASARPLRTARPRKVTRIELGVVPRTSNTRSSRRPSTTVAPAPAPRNTVLSVTSKSPAALPSSTPVRAIEGSGGQDDGVGPGEVVGPGDGLAERVPVVRRVNNVEAGGDVEGGQHRSALQALEPGDKAPGPTRAGDGGPGTGGRGRGQLIGDALSRLPGSNWPRHAAAAPARRPELPPG
jgi:hypothetical protein